ncbi:hypothetical protein pipiens_000243, partial [Culex pipiens pipiens]
NVKATKTKQDKTVFAIFFRSSFEWVYSHLKASGVVSVACNWLEIVLLPVYNRGVQQLYHQTGAVQGEQSSKML